MPRKNRVPKYCQHPNGQAYVCWQGRREYLGRHNTDASLKRYRQFIRRIELGLSPIEAPAVGKSPLVLEVIAQYLAHAEEYYKRGAEMSPEFASMTGALNILFNLYGEELADDFGPKALKRLLKTMAKRDYARSHINHTNSRIKRVFKWAGSEEIIDPMIYHRLLCVDGLAKGQYDVREADSVRPVSREAFKAILPFVSPVIREMMQVQYLCAMRPGETCIMRPCDIDRTGDVWLYSPSRHKNDWRDQSLVKAIPEPAQAILRPRLLRDSEAYLFEPREGVQWAIEQRQKRQRTTKVYPSETKRVERLKRLRRHRVKRKAPGPHYTTTSYRRAIHYGFKRAEREGLELERFNPNQLRHSIVTFISGRFGRQKAQRFAGHENLDATAIYDESEISEMIELARELKELNDYTAWASAS